MHPLLSLNSRAMQSSLLECLKSLSRSLMIHATVLSRPWPCSWEMFNLWTKHMTSIPSSSNQSSKLFEATRSDRVTKFQKKPALFLASASFGTSGCTTGASLQKIRAHLEPLRVPIKNFFCTSWLFSDLKFYHLPINIELIISSYWVWKRPERNGKMMIKLHGLYYVWRRPLITENNQKLAVSKSQFWSSGPVLWPAPDLNTHISWSPTISQGL